MVPDGHGLLKERYRDEESWAWRPTLAVRGAATAGARHKARARVFDARLAVKAAMRGVSALGARAASCSADGRMTMKLLRGRGKPESRGRGIANKSLLVLAVEKVGGAGQGGEGQRLRRRPGRGLPPAPGQCRAARRLVRAAVTPGARLLTAISRAMPSPAPAHRPRPRQERRDADPIIHVLFATSRPAQPPTMASAPSTCRASGLSLQPPPADRRPRRLRPEPRHPGQPSHTAS